MSDLITAHAELQERFVELEAELDIANKSESPNCPWLQSPLDELDIVGMNHYHIAGEKMLFVAMTKNGRCITEEGPDDNDLWSRLRHKARVEI